MTDGALVFDRAARRLRRDRLARLSDGDRADAGFLFAEVGERLADRLDDVTRRFPLALDLGARDGLMGRLLNGRGGIETLIQADPSPALAALAPGMALAMDEETLALADASLDLVVSNLALHWVNDLPGCLIQARRALKPDGLFLAAMLGGETLRELRWALTEAEQRVSGGVSPRVSPFADVRDAGALLQRAGFALPVVDLDEITVSYGDPLRLMADLRAMGESNAVLARRRQPAPRRLLAEAAGLYRERFGDADGRVPATFQVLFLTAWSPHETQQRPAARGSGQVSLTDALNAPPSPPSPSDE
ncbi:MAG: methyltransferase domain-containing protein [Rhodobacterales bacterium]|nr:methyltransferase domain-containing protein [Rhodobacterales bacterium]